MALVLPAMLAGVSGVDAQTTTPARSPQPAPSSAIEQESAASPRYSLEQFLTLARAGRFEEAAAYLEPAGPSAQVDSSLARQLKAVLDRYIWFDLERVSGSAVGDTADGLPRRIEQVGTIRGPDGVPTPIRLARNPGESEIGWRFTVGTLARIPLLYDALDNRWALEHLPSVLLRPGPFDILRWQWIALAVLVAVAVMVGSVLSRVLHNVVARAVARTRTEWDDAILERLTGPMTVALTLAIAAPLIPWLSLYQPAADSAYRVVRVGFLTVFFWSLWRLVDVIRQVLYATSWARNTASSRALLPLAARVAKVMVAAVTAVVVLSLLGYPVASLLAGLGLGGLALALAAQKTVENLFGAFSIGLDQPFREGDFVKIEEFVGTVEAIGLRSCRFRTLDRTLITIPNGRLADMRLESFTERDRLRLSTIIGLVYETTASQMREVLAGFERVLRAHPKIWPDAVVVRFREFAASSLDIEIMAWFQTSNWGEFQLIRQEVLLQFMDVVDRAGTSFAFPTQTVHLGAPALDVLRGEPARGGARNGAREAEALSAST